MSELKHLGNVTNYDFNYRPDVLESFDNKHPENDYWVKFNCPEFTSSVPHYRAARFCDYLPQLHS